MNTRTYHGISGRANDRAVASARPGRAGFTLIELLVVIGIIALLIGILVPVLGKAKEAARTVMCGAHLRASGQGLAVYLTNFNDWLPGPNTSGYYLTVNSAMPPGPDTPDTPVQNHDWVSPTMGTSIGLASGGANAGFKREISIFNTKLRCPSNNALFDGVYGASPGPSINALKPWHYTSYSAVWWFMFYPDHEGPAGGLYCGSGDAIQNASGYSPRFNRIGPPDSKIYALEGARYVNNTMAGTLNGGAHWIDWNVDLSAIKGSNFTIDGAAFDKYASSEDGNGSPYRRNPDGSLSTDAKTFAFRHAGRLNAVFYDGHVSLLNDTTARYVDNYAPTGSTVHYAAGLYTKKDSHGAAVSDGYVVP